MGDCQTTCFFCGMHPRTGIPTSWAVYQFLRCVIMSMDDQPPYGQITQLLTSAICIIDYHCIIGFFLQRPTS